MPATANFCAPAHSSLTLGVGSTKPVPIVLPKLPVRRTQRPLACLTAAPAAMAAPCPSPIVPNPTATQQHSMANAATVSAVVCASFQHDSHSPRPAAKVTDVTEEETTDGESHETDDKTLTKGGGVEDMDCTHSSVTHSSLMNASTTEGGGTREATAAVTVGVVRMLESADCRLEVDSMGTEVQAGGEDDGMGEGCDSDVVTDKYSIIIQSRAPALNAGTAAATALAASEPSLGASQLPSRVPTSPLAKFKPDAATSARAGSSCAAASHFSYLPFAPPPELAALINAAIMPYHADPEASKAVGGGASSAPYGTYLPAHVDNRRSLSMSTLVAA